jgi:hypothetical protein
MTPLEVARQIERDRRPWWIVWYGRYTGRDWAMALWVPGPVGVLEAPTPGVLVAAITNFDMLHPKPTTVTSPARQARSSAGSWREASHDRGSREWDGRRWRLFT